MKQEARDVVIVGAGGHGKVVLDILRSGDAFNAVAFLDANENLHKSSVAGLQVAGHLNVIPRLKSKGVRGAIVAIGDNRARASYAEKLAAAGIELINAIHPSTVVSPTATLGRNIVIAAGAIVCTDSRLADSVIINTAAVVDHECDIGEAAHICPGVHLAGRVTVGAFAMVGIGANVLPCLRIGEGATVGGGALVRKDVMDGATAVGVPARVIKTLDARLAI